MCNESGNDHNELTAVAFVASGWPFLGVAKKSLTP
jgi:hypothetical protein